MSAEAGFRVTIRTRWGDLRGDLWSLDPDDLLARVNEAAGVLDGMGLITPLERDRDRPGPA